MTSTYAKRPSQTDRLGQVAHKRQSIATAPNEAADGGDRLSGTTLEAKGATSPEMRRSRAEQSSGDGGRSSMRQAPSNTSAGVASGKLESTAVLPKPTFINIGHGTVRPSGESSSTLEGRVNPNSYRSNTFNPWPATDEKLSGRAAVAVWLVSLALAWAAAIYFVTWALSTGPA